MTLKYPQGAGGGDSDYVSFSPLKYRSNQSGGAAPPPSSGAESVVLYMPNSTPSIGNGNSWAGETFMGPSGAIRKEAGRILGSIAYEGYSENLSVESVTQKLNDAASRHNSNDSLKALGQQGMKIAGEFIGVSPNQQLALGAGAVFNPNVELFYSSPRLRPFTMNFDFVPKNQQEAQMMNRIIMNFKKWSAPLDLENGMFEIPHVWQVKYMTGGSENQNMNKFKKAACINVNVQANSATSMHVAHDGGVPIITTMSLQFQEVDIITRQDHEKVGGQGY